MQKVVQYKDNWRVGAKISHDNVKVLKPVAHHNSIESRGSCLHTGGIPTWTFHLEHFNWSADPVWKIHGLHSALYRRSKRCAWAHWLTRVEKGCALSLSCSVKQPWHGTLSNVFFLERWCLSERGSLVLHFPRALSRWVLMASRKSEVVT